MGKTINKRPLSMREGKVYIDGTLVADSCALKITFQPTVWSGKTLSEAGTNRRWLGYDITGNIKKWKTNTFWKKKVLEYIKTGATPEMTIVGIADDKNSDFYDSEGAEKVTVLGVVITGDINLIDLDTDGEVVEEDVSFGAYKVA